MDGVPQDYEVFDLGDSGCRAARCSRRQARLQDVRRAQRGPEQRRRLSDVVLGLSLGQRVADRRGHGPRPRQVLHRHPEHARQRALELAVQHAAAVRPRALPASRSTTRSQAQHKLVTEQFGIETLALVSGWSMGAGQTYQWAVSHPDMVQRACPFCGSSKTSEHNFVFLEGVKAALTADAAFQEAGTTRRRSRACAPPPACTPAGASPRPSTGTRSTRSIGLDSPRWRTSSSGSGRATSSTAVTPTTCCRCSGPGSTGDIGNTPGFDGDHVKALQSIKARLIVPAGRRRTSTSRPRTSSGRPSTSPTASAA